MLININNPFASKHLAASASRSASCLTKQWKDREGSLDDYEDDRGFARREMTADAGPDPDEILRRIQVREVLGRFAAKLSPSIRLDALGIRRTSGR
jgi:hypothetical protein